MSVLLRLKSSRTLQDLANLLGVKPAHLSYVLYKKPVDQKYTTFTIPKKYGGTRTINAPIADLKYIQQLLANRLLECWDSLNRQYERQAVHGFTPKRSILTNAHVHRGRAYVFNLDLEDFFGSINFGRVRGFFIQDHDFALAPKIATLIAQIACYNNSLPQGSPASPVISNLIGNLLDIHLVRLADRNECTYTRYADDITFSTNHDNFPKQIAELRDGKWYVSKKLNKIIIKSGFSVNDSKVRMQYKNSQQIVTGLVVNDKANTQARYRRTLRAMAHRLFKSGAFQYEWSIKDPVSGALVKQSESGISEQLQGMFAHVNHVDQFNQKVRNLSETKNSGRDALYRRFLFYSQFFTAPAPVILCEGPTDNIYMTCAIQSLAAKFPQLATVNLETSKIDLKVRLYKYINKSTGKILRLYGGYKNLEIFIEQYLKDIKKYFKVPEFSKHPVIILVDHDEGGKSVYNRACKIARKSLDINNPFEHVSMNLYLIATPISGNKMNSCIEECFPRAILDTLLEGKKFNYKKSNPDEKTEYSKMRFAENVIRINAATIDFTGFAPILDSIEKVILHYDAISK